MKVTGTHHVALATPSANFERLRAFYVDTLGFPQVGAFGGRPPGQEIVFLQAGDTTIELIARGDLALPDGAPTGEPPGWAHLAFDVEDLDAAHAELAAKGVAFHVSPMDVPSGTPVARVAFFRDPDGNSLELFQPIGPRYPTGD